MTAERQSFPARTEALAQVSAFVEGRCGELAAGRPATLRLLLVAEELFVNAVEHGYGGDGGGSVTITVRECGDEVELIAEDEAVPFDPFAGLQSPDCGPDPASRPPGGLGRLLVAGVSVRHAYERRGRRNRVTVAVRKAGG
jgi:serine/threonine-protein kinase RsbW